MSTLDASGPHSRLFLRSEQERFAAALFDTLWQHYRQQVPYVQVYERLIAEAGGTFVNDHIALRTLASQTPLAGLASVARLFVALGYQAAGTYHFDDKHLAALHFQHPGGQLPKLFISELKTWELSRPVRDAIAATVRKHRPLVELETLARLQRVDELAPPERESLLHEVASALLDRPWPAPERETLLAVNQESQYAAWVLVHGYNVNHFTALVSKENTFRMGTIEAAAEALRSAGVPMKPTIEGAHGSPLRQTATEAATIEVDVVHHSQPERIAWPYAYFELAERSLYRDPVTGQEVLFHGFLGAQATNLFDMTRRTT